MRGRMYKDPREITVRWNARCAETGKVLTKGQPALYYPSDKRMYHLDSQTAQQWREWQDDRAMGWDY